MEVPSSPVYIEQGARRCFAVSLDWPGLCRSGKGEEAALEALYSYLPRYSPVVERAGFEFPLAMGAAWAVVGRLPTRSGGADFGVPTSVPEQDRAPWPPGEARRGAALLSASWDYFDEVVAAAPAELRKGPRGGGRDRDAIAAHVAGGEQLYGRKAGLKLPAPGQLDGAGVAANRQALLAWCQSDEGPAGGAAAGPSLKRWPLRYALRRLVWHVLDHAWEIEDRSH